ncbi:MAG: sugar transferase [Phycisphaerae bacterium]
MLIHFGGDLTTGDGAGEGRNLRTPWEDRTHLINWYCRWAAERAHSVYVLLPERLRGRSDEILPHLGHASPLWYNEDGALSLCPTRRRGQVWVINGGRLPVVDWSAAHSALRRHDTDVLVFGSSSVANKGHYPESVLVDTTGEVVGFQRHYDDSPGFADLWSGEASFLVTPGENAAAVVNHVLTRGWCLDSIGAITRRFSVRWSDTPCTLSESSSTSSVVNVTGRETQTVNATLDRTYLVLKRTTDLIASAVGLVVLSPLLIIVAILVKCTSRGPVLFGHKRQGLGGKEFRCLKFRSMRVGADALQAELRAQNEVDGPQFKIARDPRLTWVGHWLRRLNLDELPQLINVFLGQMSLVGPRPSPDGENQFCPAWRRTRLSVKPGITGLWQVLRLRDVSRSDFQEWIYYDVEYARHRSLRLDWQLLLHTPVSMFAPRRLAGFAKRLERRGICPHAASLHHQYASTLC